jgi:hypothetical protein
MTPKERMMLSAIVALIGAILGEIKKSIIARPYLASSSVAQAIRDFEDARDRYRAPE